MCPSIFETAINSPNSTSRLLNLVIRLHLPDNGKPVDVQYGSRYIFDAKSCYPGGKRLNQEMVLAGLQLAKARPSMTGVRISFRRGGQHSIVVADCKEEAAFYPMDRFIYKDGTLVEGPWEDSVKLQRHRFSFMSLLPACQMYGDLSVSLV